MVWFSSWQVFFLMFQCSSLFGSAIDGRRVDSVLPSVELQGSVGMYVIQFG